MSNFEERINILHMKLTVLVGSKGENDSEFTFQDFYDVEELIKAYSATIPRETAKCAPTEAEIKCERVSRFCKTQRSLIRNGKAQPDVKLLTDIIWILEDKENEKE